MAHHAGKDLYIDFAGVALTADERSLTTNENTNTADTTSGVDEYESHVITTKNADWSMTLLYEDSAAGLAVRTAVKNGAQGTLTWGPAGTASGKPKYAWYATITSFSHDSPYDGEEQYTISGKFNGAYTSHYEQSGGSDTW